MNHFDSFHDYMREIVEVGFSRLHGELDATKGENHELKQHNNELKKELWNHQRIALRHLPTDDLSDASVHDEFVRLRESLSTWVEEFPDVSDGFLDSFQSAMGDIIHRSVGYGMSKSFPEGPVGVQSELLTEVSFGYIWKRLFDVLTPGPSRDNALLTELRDKMSLLTPRKGLLHLLDCSCDR